jgi:hypothetical protein
MLLDVSRFDQHVNLDALTWETDIYHWFFPQDRRFRWMLDKLLHNRGFCRTRDGDIEYRLDGKRMSGDMSTALGNVLLMCAILVSFLDRTLGRESWRIFDDGDDCCLLLEEDKVDVVRAGITEWFKSCGFKLKIEQVTDVFEQIQFCQSSPVFDGEKWRMVRDPRVVLEKDINTVRMFRTRDEWIEMCQAIAGCGMSLAGDIPVYCSFYRMLGVHGYMKRESPETGADYLALGLEMKFSQPTDEARLSFYRAFDITPHEQILLEDYYSGITVSWSDPAPMGDIVEDLVSVLITRK